MTPDLGDFIKDSYYPMHQKVDGIAAGLQAVGEGTVQWEFTD